MTEEQKQWLLEAMMHLEMIDGLMGPIDAMERAWAAQYLVQRAVLGHVPENWDEVLGAVRETDAKNSMLDLIDALRSPEQVPPTPEFPDEDDDL